MARLASPLPPSFRIELDPSTRLIDDELVVGGDPRCVVRLQGRTLACFHLLASGTAIDAVDRPAPRDSEALHTAGALARRLVDSGFAHPLPHGPSPGRDDVTVVVPVHNGAARLAPLVDSLGTVARIVVVDDGSSDTTAATAARLGATVVRHAHALGPAAARNSGLAEVTTAITMFVDDDAILEPGWDVALTHFADPAVGAVLPRIKPSSDAADPTRAERYELALSPYDLGPNPGLVARQKRLGAGSSVVVLGSTAALRDVHGFDASLRFGEDADLFWRLADAGWRVRHDPSAGAHHQVRSRVKDVLDLHFRYGSGDAALTQRHGHRSGGTMSASVIAGAVLIAAGRPRLAAATVAVQTSILASGLVKAGLRPALAARLSAAWQISSLRTLAAVGTSTAAPLTLAAVTSIPRLRPLAATALLGRHLQGWRTVRPQLDPVTWLALRTADDAAHALGTWAGMLKHHDERALLPILTRPLVDGSRADAREPLTGWTTVAVFG
jgi:mycofactocin system glycosyltransferase